MKANDVTQIVMSLIILTNYIFSYFLSALVLPTVEPGYNDIGLCDTSSIACDILWYQLVRYVLPSVTTLLYNDPQYSARLITL